MGKYFNRLQLDIKENDEEIIAFKSCRNSCDETGLLPGFGDHTPFLSLIQSLNARVLYWHITEQL